MYNQQSKYTNGSGTFPNWTAIDTSGAGLTDGTEYKALCINDGWEGVSQAIMDYASGSANAPTGTPGTPNGVTEAAGVSQIIQAIQRGNAIGPGIGVIWWKDDDPATTGDRVLLFEGQGILHANYTDLLDAVYVGDAANAAVAAGGGFFYKSSDAAGTTPDTTATGVYLQLPDARGYALRGLDTAAAVDPDGASRYLGDVQLDAMQRIKGAFSNNWASASGVSGVLSGSAATGTTNQPATGGVASYDIDFDNANSTSPNAAKTDDIESRMTNISTKFGITY